MATQKKKKQFMQDIIQKSIPELIDQRNSLCRDLYSARMKHAVKGLKQTHILRNLRKQIARINTVLTSKLSQNNGNTRR